MSKYYDKLVAINESLTRELNPGVDGTPSTTTNEEKPTEVVQENEDDTITLPTDALTDDQKKDILTDKGVDKEVVDNMKDSKEIDAALDATLNNDNVEKESVGTDTSLMDWEGPAIIVHQDVDCANEFYVDDGVWSTDVKRATEFEDKEAAKAKIEELCERDGLTDDAMFIWSASIKIDEDGGEGASDMVYVRIDDDDLEKHGYLSRIPAENEEPEWVDDEKDAMKVSRDGLQDVIKSLSQVHHYDPETISVQDCDSQVPDDGENWVTIDPTTPSATTLP